MKYRQALPQLAGKQMITDGGLETTLIFHDGIDLPLFAAFKALESDNGIAAMAAYMERYARIAVQAKRGFVMDTPTWRASARWAAKLSVSQEALRAIHRETLCTLAKMRDRFETEDSPFVLSGVIGPQDDGYAPTQVMTAAEAEAYHTAQVGWFEEFGADMVNAATMTYSDEAIGIASVAKAHAIPVAISFTVETDGNLPSGETLAEAIRAVDEATEDYPAYFMINCAHTTHFEKELQKGGHWVERIRGLRANASRMSHAELNASDTLDDGDPVELAGLYAQLTTKLPNLSVMGGCCGTDHRHIAAICAAMTSP